MISHLRGTIFSLGIQSAVIDVSGVGYDVSMPTSCVEALGSVGDDVNVFISMKIRDDGISLYGFAAQQDRDVFEKLITVSGVGPKVAMSALSAFTSDDIMSIIANGDDKRLSFVPGIGKKTAQRMMIDLKGAFEMAVKAPVTEKQSDDTPMSEAMDALLSMGFTLEETQLAIEGFIGNAEDVQGLVRYALKRLGS